MLKPLRRCLILVGVLAAALPSEAADPELGKAGAAAPAELSAAVREALAPEGLVLEQDGKPLAELWLRKELPVKEAGGAAMGVSFGQLEQGTLVGAARFPAPWTDYRGQSVAPGVYTLRYALQPADGNHMGVTLYRDFLLLLPAAEDPGAGLMAPRAAEEASRKASGTNHPAVLGLFPLTSRPEAAALFRNELDQWVLAAPAGPLALGLVLQGHAEVEGYR